MTTRTFSTAFTIQMAKAAVSGEKSVAHVSREHAVSESALHTWKTIYHTQGETGFHTPVTENTARAEAQEIRELRAKVARLERLAGQHAMERAIVKKVQDWPEGQR